MHVPGPALAPWLESCALYLVWVKHIYLTSPVRVQVGFTCCRSCTSGVVNGKWWSDDHTWAEVTKACEADPHCLGLMWKKGAHGKQAYVDGGAFQMCRSKRDASEGACGFYPRHF